MLFRIATSVALLAAATNVAAEPRPYKLAVMPLTGLSLARRDTSGYIPEETVCGEGNTCAEACGGGYTQCTSNDAATHCFNPEAGQNCCTDGTGNSCEDGYYCTHDSSLQTWCCPDSMDLAECAAAYDVEGGLETPEPTTSTVASTTSVSSTSTSTSSTPSSTSTPWTSSTSVYTPTSTWFTANSTTSSASVPGTTVLTSTQVVSPPESTTSDAEDPEATGAAAVSGVSLSLLIAAAGFLALF